MPPFDDTEPAALVLTFAVPVWQKLDALEVSAPAQYDAWFVLRTATTSLRQIAETSGDEVTQKTLGVLEVLWGAMFEHGENDLLEKLAKVASKLNHEQHPDSQERAPPSLPALAKQLTRSLRLYVDRIGAIDAATEERVQLTRWQVARYVLARALLPFVKDASLRADVDALTWAIYERMPLGEDGKPGNGNVTDVDNEHLRALFAEDPRLTVAAALRVIASRADANDAIKRLKGPRRAKAPARRSGGK